MVFSSLFSSKRIALLSAVALSVGFVAPLAQAQPAAHHVAGHVAGDIDGDGRADLVVSRAHGISVFYTGGLGRQNIAIPSGYVTGVAVGDFNGDGSVDVAVGNDLAGPDSDGLTYDGAVYVWYGAHGRLGARVDLLGPAGRGDGFGGNIKAVQINGDHRTDLVVVDDDGYTFAPPRVTVLLGRAAGLATSHAWYLGRQHTTAVAVGDLNADGHADLVLGRPETGATVLNDDEEVDAQEGTLAIYYGTAHGLAPHPQIIHGLRAGVGYGAFGTSLAIAKINGDRYADLVAGAPTTSLDAHGRPTPTYYSKYSDVGTIAVLYGSRTGVSARHRSVISVATPGVPGSPVGGDNFGMHVTTGDLNGDGRNDVIAEKDQEFNGRDGAVYVFRGAASGISTTHVQRIGSHTLANPHHQNYEAMLYGSALTVYRPTHSRHAWLAIGAPGYIKSATQWLGFVDLFPSSSAGLTTHGAHRIFGTVDKGYFGEYLAG